MLYIGFGLLAWALPETSARHEGFWAALVPRIGLPVSSRAAFARSAPALFAGWATGGFYLSLGAPLVQQTFGEDEPHRAGAGRHGADRHRRAQLATWRAASAHAGITLYGTTALAVGTALGIVAIATGSLVGFLLTAVIAGTGFGTAFMGILRSITPTVGPEERGELFSAVFVISYLAFGIPAVAAGIASPHLGLATTATIYGSVVVVLSATAALLRRFTTSD